MIMMMIIIIMVAQLGLEAERMGEKTLGLPVLKTDTMFLAHLISFIEALVLGSHRRLSYQMLNWI